MVSQELLHSAKELGRLPVAELFPTNELLQFLLFRSGCPFDQFSLELVIGVFRRGVWAVNYGLQLRFLGRGSWLGIRISSSGTWYPMWKIVLSPGRTKSRGRRARTVEVWCWRQRQQSHWGGWGCCGMSFGSCPSSTDWRGSGLFGIRHRYRSYPEHAHYFKKCTSY